MNPPFLAITTLCGLKQVSTLILTQCWPSSPCKILALNLPPPALSTEVQHGVRNGPRNPGKSLSWSIQLTGSRLATLNHIHFLPSERTSLFFLESTGKAPNRAERSSHKGRRGPWLGCSSGTSQEGQEGRSVALTGGPRARTMIQSSGTLQTSAIVPLFPSHLWLRTCAFSIISRPPHASNIH